MNSQRNSVAWDNVNAAFEGEPKPPLPDNSPRRFRGLTTFLILTAAITYGFQQVRRISKRLMKSASVHATGPSVDADKYGRFESTSPTQTPDRFQSVSVSEPDGVSLIRFPATAENPESLVQALVNLVQSAETRLMVCWPNPDITPLRNALTAAAQRGVKTVVLAGDRPHGCDGAFRKTLSVVTVSGENSGRLPMWITVDGITAVVTTRPLDKSILKLDSGLTERIFAVRVVSPDIVRRLDYLVERLAVPAVAGSVSPAFHSIEPLTRDIDGCIVQFGAYGSAADDDVWLNTVAASTGSVVILNTDSLSGKLDAILAIKKREGVVVDVLNPVPVPVVARFDAPGASNVVLVWPISAVVDSETILVRCAGKDVRAGLSLSFSLQWRPYALRLARSFAGR